MRSLAVDDIMKKPVHTVEADQPLKEAMALMQRHGTKKILVVERHRPIGVLERWRVLPTDLERRVGDVELARFKVVPSGTSVEAIQSDLVDVSAVYVQGRSNELVGVLTAHDFVQAL